MTGGGGLFCGAPWGALGSLLNRLWRCTQRDPLRLSGICRAFTMACICHGAKGNRHRTSPYLASQVEEFLLSDVCLFLFSSVSCVYKAAGCWVATKWCQLHVKFSTIRVLLLLSEGLLCSEKRFKEMGKSPFYQFLSSTVFTSLGSVVTQVFFVRLDFCLGVKSLLKRWETICQRTETAMEKMFLIRAVRVHVSPAVCLETSFD